MDLFLFHWQWNESSVSLVFSLLMPNEPYSLEIRVGERELGKDMKKTREMGENCHNLAKT